jgi:UDP-N-acetylglucosamine/UDP-N-acetylgalactosamine diphosphorylase
MDALQQLLAETGQSHLWTYAEELPEPQRTAFLSEVARIDWRQIAQLYQQATTSGANDAKSLAQFADPPERLVRLTDPPSAWQAARERGEAALRAGKVAAILVAGGEGTRLGFDGPKGMYPIGPLSGKTLFQLFAEQLIARRRKYGVRIPYLIMTSDATHADSIAFWQKHDYFGLPADDVRFFCQGHMPALDFQGRALFTGPGQLVLSPDGHGGLLAALDRSGLLHELAQRGIETLYYHQVDNPTTIVCDAAFIGWHLQEQADVSTKVVAKCSAAEKMGVVVTIDGVTRVIEYSDLPADVAAQTDERGALRIWAGNTAMHVFQRGFLERALQNDAVLPFHIARKAVPHWTPSSKSSAPAMASEDSIAGARGYEMITPDAPNAFKFERFIFDVLPWADRALIVEADRAAEFNPVKNKSGADTPETARAGLQALYRSWLRQAGAIIADDVPVEISPLRALDEEDVKGRIKAGMTITGALDWSH